MTASSLFKSRARRWGTVLIVLTMVVVTVGVVVLARPGRGTGPFTGQLTFVVKHGPLTISVTESGTIKARDKEILKNEVEGQTTIIQLVPEGKLVKAGELLVELDASKLQDDKIDQQIQVQNADAAFVRAREDLAVAESQAESDIAKAELDYRFAQEDVKQYLEGQYLKELKEAESKITLAEEELERAGEKLEWSETLFKEKYISQMELEADRLTKNRAQLDHELAVASRDLLKDFTYHRTLAQLNSDVDQTRMALERVQRTARADIVQAKAELKAKDLEFQQQKGKLEKIEQQIDKTKIHAPIDGMVIYATSTRGSWRGSQEPLDEGQMVREREELIHLPTAGAMVAEVKLHESNLNKVRPGLPVQVTVDALPRKVFTGRVATIAPLPDAQSLWLNPDLKIYDTSIHLDGSGEGLRTGMSCQAEIIVEHYDDAVYVPVQAVLRVGRQPTVYVLGEGNQVEARSIELGLDNNRMARIISGLQPGEKVLLAPPLAPATAPGDDKAPRMPGPARGRSPTTVEKSGPEKDLSKEQEEAPVPHRERSSREAPGRPGEPGGRSQGTGQGQGRPFRTSSPEQQGKAPVPGGGRG